jgi:hypothetical protein
VIIGLDFDNTIVNYTGIFHEVAVNHRWLPSHVGNSKRDVKDYFIENGDEGRWTELQGLVYGSEIHKAVPYPGVIEFIDAAKRAGHEIVIISHKTQYPYIGEKVDFHVAAKSWLDGKQISAIDRVPSSQCYFNETKEAKLQKINELGCSIFIDDLPSILQHDSFPKRCRGVLFAPNENVDSAIVDRIVSWSEAHSFL